MEIVYDETGLDVYMREAVRVSREHPVLIDDFLQNAVEIDVDAVCDGKDVLIGAIMEHIEEAGIHSGDSACMIPPQTLPGVVLEVVRDYVRKIALGLGVVGIVNLQMAYKDGTVYVLEANPRSSRTIPFVSKAVGLPLAKIAANVMIGRSPARAGLPQGAQDALRLGQGGAPAFRQVTGRRCSAGAGDEVHGRGHGHRLQAGPGLLQSGAVCGQSAAPGGHWSSYRSRMTIKRRWRWLPRSCMRLA